MSYDTFTKLKPAILRACFGHGEYGYNVIVFSTHKEKEAEKCLTYLEKLIEDNK